MWLSVLKPDLPQILSVPGLDYAALVALMSLILVTALAGLDRLTSFRFLSASRRLKKASDLYSGGGVVSDLLSRSVVRKVKVSKVGEYLIVTLVLKTTMESGSEVELEEPLVMLSDGDVVSKSSVSEV
jgi:hypothetical protein